MKTIAAVVNEYNKPLTIEEVDLAEPQVGEVMVKMVASGICHSDVTVHRGQTGSPMPMILGHEGGGIIEAVGPGVAGLKAGDHVLMTVSVGCGICKDCASGRPYRCMARGPAMRAGALPNGAKRFSKNGQPVGVFLGQGSLAQRSVVTEHTAIKVPQDVPLEVLAPLGCGIQTGAGAVMNVAKVGLMNSVAIFGCGGLGCAGIMAAKVLGANPIIAVDMLDSRLEMARTLGATHVINAAQEKPVEKIMGITAGGADFTFEFIGREDTIRQAVDSTRWHGTAVISGMAPFGTEVKLDAMKFLGVNILGNAGGCGVPDTFLPLLVELWRQGRLPVDRLIGKSYSLENVNQAFDDMNSGAVIKPVIRF